MAAKPRHIAINATDVQAVKVFYERVFGWRLEPWGPPDYYQDQEGGGDVIIALHGRRELAPGARVAQLQGSLHLVRGDVRFRVGRPVAYL